MLEHRSLQATDDHQNKTLRRQCLAVLGSSFRQCDGHDQQRHLIENTLVVRREHVERALDHQRVERGERRHGDGQNENAQNPAAMLADLVSPQAKKKRSAVLGLRGFLLEISQWGAWWESIHWRHLPTRIADEKNHGAERLSGRRSVSGLIMYFCNK